ncbi:hypothetical protein ACWCYZ_29560 [Streptomyces virginiae]
MRYLEGISLDAFGRGNRRLLAPVLAWAKEPVPVPVPEAAAEEPKAAEGEKPAKGSPAKKPEKTPEPKTRRRIGVRHLGYAAGGAFFLWPVVGGWVPTVLTTAPAVWVVAALIAGQTGADTSDTSDTADDGQEHEEHQEQPVSAVERLFDRVLSDLADAESTYGGKGPARVFVATLRMSALGAGLVVPKTTDKEFGEWLGRCRLAPVQVRVSGVKSPALGLKLEDVHAALGGAPADVLERRLAGRRSRLPQSPAPSAGQPPASTVPEVPAEAPDRTPASPVLRVLTGGGFEGGVGGQQSAPPTVPQESTQGAV